MARRYKLTELSELSTERQAGNHYGSDSCNYTPIRPDSIHDDATMGASSLQEFKTKRFWAAVVAEFLGTALLVLVACGSCLTNADPDINAKTTRISLAFGLSVASIVWGIGNVSGGHINPAVTTGFFVTRKITVVRFLLYIVFQCLGAIVGAALLKAVTPTGLQGTLGKSDTSFGLSASQVFGTELLITFIFVFVVLASCDGRRQDTKGSVPLAIGLTIAMCHLWAVPYSGAGMNPARVLGPAIVANDWNFIVAYLVAPLVGGAVGAFLYDFLFAVNATPAKIRGFFTRNYDDADFDKFGRKDAHNASQVPMTEDP